MIAPSAIERLGVNLASSIDSGKFHEFAQTHDLDLQDEATLLRLASGEAMAKYYLTGALAEHA